jgi:hypothetical protein
VDPARAEAVALALAEGFARRFGRRPRIWLCAASQGAGPLDFP